MTKSGSSKTIFITGAYIKSDAYQNVKYRISALANHPDISIKEISCNFLNTDNRIRTNKIKLLICHVISLFKIIFIIKNKNLYIPYPAIFFQYMLSYLPRIIKPKLTIIDGFISLYDTAVIDRQITDPNLWKSKLLYKVEKRVFESADYIIVDTEINREYYADLFHISPDKFVPIPLATNEIDFQAATYTPNNTSSCRVLFIGTLIPLHGIDTIIKTIEILKEYKNISFHIIGDGQDAKYVEDYISNNSKNLTWKRDWCTSQELNLEIAKSDICLGIFGSTLKAQRVCPYKIYHYSRVGRAIITSKTEWTDSIETNENKLPFALIDSNNATQLADKILKLAHAPDDRESLAIKSQEYYLQHLSVNKSTQQLVELFKQEPP